MANRNLRHQSRREFSSSDDQPTHQEIHTGALQRMADAAEKAASALASIETLLRTAVYSQPAQLRRQIRAIHKRLRELERAR